MVDITVKLTNVDDNDVDDIVNSCEVLGTNVKINITRPWPELKLGDRFEYASTEYAFLAYASKYKVRAITMNALVDEAIIQPVYFDCARREPHMRFMIRK